MVRRDSPDSHYLFDNSGFKCRLTIKIGGLSGGIIENTKDHNPAPQELGRGFTLYYLVEDVEKVYLKP
jgi:hypothetical protein